MIKDKCKQLADIIDSFRFGEISQINTNHVKKWLFQFDEDKRMPIIEEMIYVFSKWYFSREYIENEFLDKIPSFLQKKYGFSSETEACQRVSFLDMQPVGTSQSILVAELKKLKAKQLGVIINNKIDSLFSHYAYIDDGFFSGSRFRKDIKEIGSQLRKGDTIDVFFLVVCTSGALYTINEFKQLEKEYQIKINLHPLKRIENDRNEHHTYEDGTESTWWFDHQLCLWPNSKIASDPEVDFYFKTLKEIDANYEKSPYRGSHWTNDKGVFSSLERRDLVEYEFLKKGILISNAYRNTYGDIKGMYPLGYNLWPSFGFGVMFATDYNVPNNAPLVIWADAGDWYPLLPRRTNNESDDVEEDFCTDFDCNYQYDNAYNICPDCGKLFGLNEDGGNGFCIDCAWNH